MERSALAVAFVTTVEELLPGFGSVVDAVAFAVLEIAAPAAPGLM